MGFFRQEYWGGLPFPPLGDLPYQGIESTSPELQAPRWTVLAFPGQQSEVAIGRLRAKGLLLELQGRRGSAPAGSPAADPGCSLE